MINKRFPTVLGLGIIALLTLTVFHWLQQAYPFVNAYSNAVMAALISSVILSTCFGRVFRGRGE